MNVESYISSSTITNKMVLILVIITLDIICNTWVLYTDCKSEFDLGDDDSVQGNKKQFPFIFTIVASSLQFIL